MVQAIGEHVPLTSRDRSPHLALGHFPPDWGRLDHIGAVVTEATKQFHIDIHSQAFFYSLLWAPFVRLACADFLGRPIVLSGARPRTVRGHGAEEAAGGFRYPKGG